MTDEQLPLPLVANRNGNEELDIDLDIEDLTLGEIDILTSSDKKIPFHDKLEILKRVCIRGDILKVHVRDMPKLSTMIESKMESMGNPTETA